MLVWGGREFGGSGDHVNTGGRYDPATDTWTPTSTVGAPTPRALHSVVWTGDRMIVWGGAPTADAADTGGRYDPVSNSWTPTSHGSGNARSRHGAVWTGTEMIVWGGHASVNSGGRYDPLTDAWTATTQVGAPPGSAFPHAFWTGHHLLVYSGENTTAGRYDPVADAWLPVSGAGAPPPWLGSPTTTWTGNRMFVIGRRDSDAHPVAAFYNPETDVWTPLSLTGAPYITLRGTVVWTGTRIIIFGGSNGSDSGLPGTGTLFDPVMGSWQAISQQGAPLPRVDHDAFWTGTRMLVWGGKSESGYTSTGGLYDPVADRWESVSPLGAPQATGWHSALWTSDRLIVWGGLGSSGDVDTGAVYDPATDTWSVTSVTGAPAPRSGHSAVWTGGEMLVWGGAVEINGSAFRTGGSYALGWSDDRDGDGISFCAGDCDDSNPARRPGAGEICDGIDNDCDGAMLPAEALDGDLDQSPACADCDDTDPGRYPGALEFCNGMDDDCDAVIDETDRDADGSSCALDCDDFDPVTFPGAPETNDGRDNQCPGDPGFGIVDEVSGSLAFPSGAGTLCWPVQAGVTAYEVLRAVNGTMTAGCTIATSSSSCFTDSTSPPPRGLMAYLVRALAPRGGSWGVSSDGVERSAFCGREWVCDDGDDEDGDGLTDCADAADCFRRAACPATSFTFTDTNGDDVATAGLQAFFASMSVVSGDYLRFSLHGAGIDFDLCAARADFYRDSYLSLAPVSGVASFGAWEKWTRSLPGPWSGPVLDAFENWFGDACAGAWSWCAEAGIAGRFPGLAPAETNACEAFENATCSNGTWTASVAIGIDRQSACGF